MNTSSQILVLNGPNLNMLGVREPDLYGSATLGDVEELCRKTASELGLSVTCRQSNHEGELVTWIQESRTAFQGIVINAGAYSHTSIALLDAIKIAAVPVIEVHVTNVHAREEFRHHSYVATVAVGSISGMGIDGYAFALRRMAKLISSSTRK